LYEGALEIRKTELGDRHPSTATSMNNLAGLYSLMGQYDRALPLYKVAVSLFEELLGYEHPNTKVFQGNLKMARQLAFAAQESAILKAIPLLEKALGINHPITQAKRQELNRLREKM